MSDVDPKTGETSAVVETDFNPNEVAISPSWDRAFVTCSLGTALNGIDNETDQVVERFEHDQFDFPHGLALARQRVASR